LVGIKGTGMSAVAQILKANGVSVTGSDVEETFPTDTALDAAGIRAQKGFSPANVGTPDVVVASPAYGPDHPEVAEARRRGIPVLSYPEFLGRMMAEKRGVAVAGTHGKTTTTAMIAHVLHRAGLDPQAVIGIGDAYTGRGNLLVAESCEYRRHFLSYPAEVTVVTNIELDHPDYFKDVDDYEAAFREFAAKLPPGGVLICCGDDRRAAGLPTKARRVTYGYGPDNDYRLELLPPGQGNRYRVFKGDKDLGEFRLGIPGSHNALNSLAAVAVASEFGVPIETIREALAGFRGVKRRFEYIGEYDGALVYDDYAHHPTAIEATIRACRDAVPDRRVWVVFQPHTYSRTRVLLPEFADKLAGADRVVLAEIYASARENAARDNGKAPVSSRDIAALIPGGPEKTSCFASLGEIVEFLRGHLGPDDILVTMGAGDVYRVGQALVGPEECAPGLDRTDIPPQAHA
jgi:UDP-N-acetylmuramate--alanine ligase